MSVTLDTTEQDIFTALVSFLALIVPDDTPIVQGFDNRVPMPLTPFVMMTGLGIRRIATNLNTYQPADQTATWQTQNQCDIQIDFYGPNAQAWATITQTLFRDQYATALFPVNIQPLYADDPMQLPIINGEAQYERRWKVTASFAYVPGFTMPQESATSIDFTIIPVDVFDPDSMVLLIALDSQLMALNGQLMAENS